MKNVEEQRSSKERLDEVMARFEMTKNAPINKNSNESEVKVYTTEKDNEIAEVDNTSEVTELTNSFKLTKDSKLTNTTTNSKKDITLVEQTFINIVNSACRCKPIAKDAVISMTNDLNSSLKKK